MNDFTPKQLARYFSGAFILLGIVFTIPYIITDIGPLMSIASIWYTFAVLCFCMTGTLPSTNEKKKIHPIIRKMDVNPINIKIIE